MADYLRVPLPRTLLMSALVLSRTAAEDADMVISRAAGALAPWQADTLGQHIGDLRVIAVDDLDGGPVPPLPLLRGSGSSGPACDAVSTARYGWMLLLRLRPATAVSGDIAVRIAASVLASALDGVVVDTAIPRAHLPTDEMLTARASDLVTFDHEPTGTAASVTTRGLARFGVPEIAAVDVATELLPASDAVLVGVAHRMVTALADIGDTEPAVLVLELPLRLTMADVAAGYGQPLGDDPTTQHSTLVRLSGPTDGALVVDAVVDATRELFTDALPDS